MLIKALHEYIHKHNYHEINAIWEFKKKTDTNPCSFMLIFTILILTWFIYIVLQEYWKMSAALPNMSLFFHHQVKMVWSHHISLNVTLTESLNPPTVFLIHIGLTSQKYSHFPSKIKMLVLNM